MATWVCDSRLLFVLAPSSLGRRHPSPGCRISIRVVVFCGSPISGSVRRRLWAAPSSVLARLLFLVLWFLVFCLGPATVQAHDCPCSLEAPWLQQEVLSGTPHWLLICISPLFLACICFLRFLLLLWPVALCAWAVFNFCWPMACVCVCLLAALAYGLLACGFSLARGLCCFCYPYLVFLFRRTLAGFNVFAFTLAGFPGWCCLVCW